MDIPSIVAILAGLILLTGLLGVIPAFGKHLEKFAKWLGSFQAVIGIIAIVFGVLNLWSMVSIMLVIAGLVLLMGILEAIPGIGKDLHRLAKWLGGFQTLIGIITLAVGIWGLL